MRRSPPIRGLSPSRDREVQLLQARWAHESPQPLLEELAHERVVLLGGRSSIWPAAEKAQPLRLEDERLDLDRAESGRDLNQLRRDDLEDRRPHQELLMDHRKVADNLLCEVVMELVASARQAPDERPGLGWGSLPE